MLKYNGRGGLRLELQPLDSQPYLSEDSVEQMLVLAERLRASNGGVLDDSAIQAVSEATGTPVEYVRLLVKLKTEKETTGFFADLKSQYLALDFSTKRYVGAGFAAAMCAFFTVASINVQASGAMFASEFLQIIALVWLTLGLYNACTSRDARTASIVGALFAGGFFTSFEVFGFMLRMNEQKALPAVALVPSALGGAFLGLLLNRLTNRFRGQLGLKDPIRERQELLRQLQELQSKLKSGEQMVTFVSVDIVGSTHMKTLADSLSVEYTFNEYHQYIERICKKHGGRVHSTAGDGVTCAFEQPHNAYMAARNIATGLIELNTYRNTIGTPIVLRQGIHTGMVNTPENGDIKSVNFAQVIDVAAHLQKVAPPGAVVVSDDSAKFLQGGSATIGTARVQSSGVEGTVWLPRLATPGAPKTPPPLPDIA